MGKILFVYLLALSFFSEKLFAQDLSLVCEQGSSAAVFELQISESESIPVTIRSGLFFTASVKRSKFASFANYPGARLEVDSHSPFISGVSLINRADGSLEIQWQDLDQEWVRAACRNNLESLGLNEADRPRIIYLILEALKQGKMAGFLNP